MIPGMTSSAPIDAASNGNTLEKVPNPDSHKPVGTIAAQALSGFAHFSATPPPSVTHEPTNAFSELNEKKRDARPSKRPTRNPNHRDNTPTAGASAALPPPPQTNIVPDANVARFKAINMQTAPPSELLMFGGWLSPSGAINPQTAPQNTSTSLGPLPPQPNSPASGNSALTAAVDRAALPSFVQPARGGMHTMFGALSSPKTEFSALSETIGMPAFSSTAQPEKEALNSAVPQSMHGMFETLPETEFSALAAAIGMAALPPIGKPAKDNPLTHHLPTLADSQASEKLSTSNLTDASDFLSGFVSSLEGALPSFAATAGGAVAIPGDANSAIGLELPNLSSFGSMETFKNSFSDSSDPVHRSVIKGVKEATDKTAKKLIATDKSTMKEETVEYQLKAMHNQFVAMQEHKKDYNEFLTDFLCVIDYLEDQARNTPALIESLILNLTSNDSSIKPYVGSANSEFKARVEAFWAYLVGATDILKKEIEKLESRAEAARVENFMPQADYESKLKEISEHKIARLRQISEMISEIGSTIRIEIQLRKKEEITVPNGERIPFTFEDEAIPDMGVSEETDQKGNETGIKQG